MFQNGLKHPEMERKEKKTKQKNKKKFSKNVFFFFWKVHCPQKGVFWRGGAGSPVKLTGFGLGSKSWFHTWRIIQNAPNKLKCLGALRCAAPKLGAWSCGSIHFKMLELYREVTQTEPLFSKPPQIFIFSLGKVFCSQNKE